MSRSVISAMMTVSIGTDARENQRFAVKPMVLEGSTRRTESLVNSVRTAFSGLMMLTVKAAATAAKPVARPAMGWRPRLRIAVPASGISTR
jgi:hypothetical protein